MAETNMGAYHLADNPSMYQPIRTNNFRFIVSGLEALISNNNTGIGTDALNVSNNAQEVLDFSVVSFDEPDFQQDDVPIQRGNSTVYFAGKASYREASLVINDYAGADGKSILRSWQALSYNPIDDTIPSSDKYKLDAVVMEYLPDNTLVNYWELKGCWVKGISVTGYDNNNQNVKQVTATIRYDRAIPHKGE